MGIWIIGRQVELPNGHKYMAEPFICFETNEDAQAACDMVQKVSGERPMITGIVLYRKGETARVAVDAEERATHTPTSDMDVAKRRQK